jgi:hypothetical protein
MDFVSWDPDHFDCPAECAPARPFCQGFGIAFHHLSELLILAILFHASCHELAVASYLGHPVASAQDQMS